MMRTVFSAVLATLAVSLSLSLSAGAASAQGLGIKGTWGLDQKSCAKKGPSEGRLVITGQTLKFYETTCKITQLTAGRGRGVWYATASCSGEGETWTNTDIFVVRAAGQRLVRVDNKGYAASYVRCK